MTHLHHGPHAQAHIHRTTSVAPHAPVVETAGDGTGSDGTGVGRVSRTARTPLCSASRPTVPRTVDPDILDRWRTTGRLCAADVLAILADRDEGDAHPVATFVARLRAAS